MLLLLDNITSIYKKKNKQSKQTLWAKQTLLKRYSHSYSLSLPQTASVLKIKHVCNYCSIRSYIFYFIFYFHWI